MTRAVLVVLALAAALRAQAPAPDVAAIQLPEHVVVTGTLLVDVDGDGRDDLVLACRDTKTKRRELRVHRRSADSPIFANAPSAPPYAVDSDVIAFTFADCTPAKGRDLVLFTAERAVAVEFGADGAPNYVPLFVHDLVWPVADPDFVLPLPNARCDFDRDGRDDLLLPATRGAALVRNDRQRVPFVVPEWRSPLTASGNGPATIRGDEVSLRLGLGGRSGDDGSDDDDDRQSGPLVSVRTRTPLTRLVDANGDGRLDLIAVRNGRLSFGLQDENGALTMRDSTLPLPADRLSLFDPAFDVQLVKVDGDARPDLVLTTSASRDDEIEVRIDVFPTKADLTWEPKPASRLRLKTLAQAPQLVDVDGDGNLDVVAVTVRTDALKAITGGGEPTGLEAQLNVFRGNGERFVMPALSITQLQLPTKARRGGGAFVEVTPGASGTPGAVLLRDGDVLQRRPFERDGERLVLAAPSSKLAIAADTRLDATSDGAVLVRRDHELLHVRLR